MKKTLLALCLVITSSCSMMGAKYHKSQVAAEGEDFTIGAVQSKIHKGINQVSVAEILGSPNMVSTDEFGEVWVYDKVSTEYARSGSTQESGFFPLIAGAGSAMSAGASSSTQKTTTVIIKFDSNKKVRDYSYRSSKF